MEDKLRIVVGADDAGFEYKEALKRDLADTPMVESVVDIGVGADDHQRAIADYVADALRHAKGNKTRAAAALGLSRGSFYRRLERFGFVA